MTPTGAQLPYEVPTWSQGKYPLSDVNRKADGEELGERQIARFLFLLDERGVSDEDLAKCFNVKPDTARKKKRRPHRLSRENVSSLCELLDMSLEDLRLRLALEKREDCVRVLNECAEHLSDSSLGTLLDVAIQLYFLEWKLGWADGPYS